MDEIQYSSQKPAHFKVEEKSETIIIVSFKRESGMLKTVDRYQLDDVGRRSRYCYSGHKLQIYVPAAR